jgi:hypothetical protein
MIAAVTALALPARAHAFNGLKTWSEAACHVDAVVTLEIDFGGKFGPKRIKVVSEYLNLTQRKVKKKDWAFTERAFYWVLKGAKALVANKANGSGFGPLQDAAVKAGSFRMVILLKQNEEGLFSDWVMPQPAYGMVTLQLHPRFESWWRHFRQLLDERAQAAKEGKLPKWCPIDLTQVPEEWTAARRALESGWYDKEPMQ